LLDKGAEAVKSQLDSIGDLLDEGKHEKVKNGAWLMVSLISARLAYQRALPNPDVAVK